MLISLLKTVIFIFIVAGMIYGVQILVTQGSDLTIAIAGYEFVLSPVAALIAGVLLLVGIWLLLRVIGIAFATLRWLAGDETALTRYFARRRERAGYRHLSDALTSLAAGEGGEAVTKAKRAEALLRRPDLTNLISAQAFEITNNKEAATEAYKRLLDDEKTRFVGVRGLMKQRLAAGDTDTALKLAEKAFVLKPRHAETTDTLLRLQAQKENWKAARKTLGAKKRYGELPADLHRRRDAILALADAKAKLAEGDEKTAYDEAVEANRLAPSLVPAAVMAARAYIADGKPKNASNLLKKAWFENPHPDLAAAFAEIEPNESPDGRIKRFEKLIQQKPAHIESKLLRAELEIAAENFPAARRAIGNLAETDPTKRTLTLMAAIERGEGSDDSVVKAWLAKALTASPGPQWVCEVDGKVYPEWQPVTDGGFDTLTWKTAPASAEVMSANAAGMLPLIIGALEDRSGTANGTGSHGADAEGDVIDQTSPASADAPANGAATARPN